MTTFYVQSTRKRLFGRFLTGFDGTLPRWGRRRHAVEIDNPMDRKFRHPDFDAARFLPADGDLSHRVHSSLTHHFSQQVVR